MLITGQITLIIPSYGRPQFLKRLFQHYKNSPVFLIIIDGTDLSDYDTSLQDTELSSNIRYFHHPSSPISERIKFALNHIDTPFSALMCDDEFYTFEGLSRSMEIMLDDKTVTSSIGLCMGFKKNNKDNSVVFGDFYNYKPCLYSPLLPKRLESFFSHYSPTAIYSLCTTDSFIDCMTGALAFNWSSSNVIEIAFSMLILFTGNHHIHNTLHWLRSDENQPIHSQLNRKLGIYEWHTNQDYKEEHIILLNEAKKISSLYAPKYAKYSHHLLSLSFEAYNYSQRARKALVKFSLMASKNYNRLYTQNALEYLENRTSNASILYNVSEMNSIVSAVEDFGDESA